MNKSTESKVLSNGISVVIATHNGSKIIGDTLNHLVHQDFKGDYEIIVVDNASTDGTFEYVRNWWEVNGRDGTNFQAFKEPKPGKTFAQDLGFEKAQYKYLLVCDDDNQLFPDFIRMGFEYMEEHPNAGILGGQGVAKSNDPLPDWFQEYQIMYAVGPQCSFEGDVTQRKKFVHGAGSIIRNDIWQKLVKSGIQRLLNSENGKARTCGEDNEMGYLMVASGFEIHFNSTLKFYHFITPERFSLDYLKKLRLGYALAIETYSSYTWKLKERPRSNMRMYNEGLRSLVKVVLLFISRPFYSGSNKKMALRNTFHRGRVKDIWQNRSAYGAIRRTIARNLELAAKIK